MSKKKGKSRKKFIAVYLFTKAYFTYQEDSPKNLIQKIVNLLWCMILFLKERRVAIKLTVIIEKEGDGYVSLCPEFDIASQGKTIEEARDNLKTALELFLETASSEEIKERI